MIYLEIGGGTLLAVTIGYLIYKVVTISRWYWPYG